MRWRSRCVLAAVSAAILAAQSPAPGRVELTVVDDLDVAIPGASVELSRTGITEASVRQATTDDRGLAVFPRVDPGPYRVTLVQASGFLYDSPRPNEVRTIEVVEGGTARLGNITVRRLGAIEGTVTFDTGEPVAGARVSAFRYLMFNGVKTLLSVRSPATTDKQGIYRIMPLNPGIYYVRATGGTPPFVPTWYPNADRTAEAVRVAVASGEAWPSANFRIKRSGTFHIRGMVAGIPDKTRALVLTIESCANGVRESPPFLAAAVPTKVDGSFDAGEIPPGRYCLTFDGRNEAATMAYAEDVVIVTDRDVENLRLSASAPFEIVGSVKADEGQSLSLPASIELMTVNALGRIPLKGNIDPKTGVFAIAGVLPTEYKLTMPGKAGEYIKRITFAGRDITDGIFSPAPGGALSIEVGTGRGRLHGRVDLGSAVVPNGVSVTLAPDGPSANRTDLLRTISSASNGEFSVNDLAPATYRVYAWERYEPELLRFPEFGDFFPSTQVRIDGSVQQDIQVDLIPSALIDAAKTRF